MKLIPYGRQFIDDDDINEVVKVIRSDFLTQGPKIAEFENELAKYCGAKYAVVLNSGTSALHGAYFALGLKNGDEFITSPNTFVATANAGLYLGAKPIFADIEKDTGNLDPSKIEEKVTSKTKLIVPVHYSGHPADLKKFHDIARKNKIFLIDDACHAIGALYQGEKIGCCKYSEMTILSFHPVKHITTGEGGAVLTNNEEYYNKLLMFRSHGITKNNFINDSDGDWYYEMQLLGYNYRMTDIHAALGISQLKKLDKFIQRRREIAKKYKNAFNNNPYFDIPLEKDYAGSSYHLYPIKLKKDYYRGKNKIIAKLREKGISSQVHYIPVYLQPYYKNLGYKAESCPLAEDFYKREISIPMYPGMSDENINNVIEIIPEVFKELL